ncbi:MAG: PDZ domain-containing protein [Planctomycetales bacterium]|nr:PDZ domain-containing protein [Planctomycetales bacterium]
MERRTLFAIFVIATAALGNFSIARGDSASFADEIADIDQIISRGLELEKREDWAEALTHYEDAVRLISKPDLKSSAGNRLRRRLGVARLHFDLERRYNDSSFYQGLRTVSKNRALDLYDELLHSIESNYVDAPNWNALLRNGTTGLSIALRDQTFQKTNQTNLSYDESRRVIDLIWQTQIKRDYQTRRQALDFVRWASDVVAQQTGVPGTASVLEYTCGATSALDTYSTFLTGNELDEVYSQIEGNFVGLGIELKPDADSLLIDNVIAKGPADRAGIKKGDRIVEVDGQATSVVSAERAADMLRGEENTYVQVGVKTGDELRRLYIRRERVEVPSVEDVGIIDKDDEIGYLKISSFQKTTYEDVSNALWALHRQGMRTLIVDVRGNPGGLLDESVEVADLFIKRGVIVETRGRSARENSSYRAHETGTWRVPLVVLIDGDSASASEIFAGAIRDHGVGKVVGERSYGKGSVQGIFQLRTVNAGIKLTTAKFYSPSQRAISGNGVEPDVAVNLAQRHITARPTDDGGFVELDAQAETDMILEAGKKAAVQQMMAALQNREQAGR